MPHKLTPEDSLTFPIVSDAQIDPAAAAVAYVRADCAREGTALIRQQIWVVDSSGRRDRRLTHGPRADFHPRWSPDGRQLAFLSDRVEDGRLQLYLLDREGGEARQLTHVEGEIDCTRYKDTVQWSPDGKQLAFLMIDPDTAEEKKRHEETGGALEFEKTPKFTRLWTVEAATGALRPVIQGDVQVWEFAWSPDGREFALIVSDAPYEWSWHLARLARAPARGGPPRTVFAPPQRQIALPRWSPDQKYIAFISSIWSDRGSIDGDVFLVSARGGQPRDISPDYPGSIGWMEWKKNGRALLTIGYEQGQAAVGELDVASGRAHTLWRQPVEVADRYWPRFSLAKDGRTLAVARAAPHAARDVWTGAIAADGVPPDLSGGRVRWKQLTDAAPQVRDFALGQQEIVSWTSRDGWPMRGVLIKPVGYRDGKRCPLIVNPHGGPTSLAANGFMATNLWGQCLAARGYAVFFPNYRGSTGFGLKFAEANLGDLGGHDFEDIDSGVEALIERGLADPARLGFGGWSYGGFMTAWTVTRTDRYKAAVMGAGITNWPSFHGNSHLHAWDAIHYDADPYERDGVYARFSAMNFVGRVKTPTLIVHGELDRDVPPEQSYQFYRALVDHGVDTELVIYPREGHGPTEKKHWLDLHHRIANWYDKYLK